MIKLEENKGTSLKGWFPCCPNHFILELTFVGNVSVVSSTLGGHAQVVPSVYIENRWTECINGGQKKYSFVFVLISLTSLVCTDRIQKKSCFRTRLVGLISAKTKEYFFGRHLCIRSIMGTRRYGITLRVVNSISPE